MGIEPTARYGRAADFEDQEGHQTLIASVRNFAFSWSGGKHAPVRGAACEADGIEIFQ